MAAREGSFHFSLFSLTLLFALLIQIGTNYSNDYFDFMKGADTKERLGPKRAVQQGWIAPSTMLKASLIAFGAAFLFAIPLMLIAGWWSWCVALLAILSSIFYTGGPRPFGYLGLGELFVFIFFGPVATVGTYFLQTNTINLSIFIASLAPALLSSAILMANNLRDAKTDRAANKKTLVVRYGTSFGRVFYIACIQGAALTPFFLFFCGWPGHVCLRFVGGSLILFLSSFRKVSLEISSFLLLIYTLLFATAVIW